MKFFSSYNLTMSKYYLAIDIGASSGRHIIGYVNNDKLEVEEIYRFKNAIDVVNGKLTWDINRLFKEIKEGIKIALKKFKSIESMSIDTWGVDYVLLDENEKENLPDYAYRSGRTKAVISEVDEKISF